MGQICLMKTKKEKKMINEYKKEKARIEKFADQ